MEKNKRFGEYICKSLASAASGAVLYLLILKITLWATGTAMADYQGGADISVSGIPEKIFLPALKSAMSFLSVFLWYPCKTQYAAGNCSCICFDFLWWVPRLRADWFGSYAGKIGKTLSMAQQRCWCCHDVHGIYGGNLAGVVLYSHVRRSGLVPAGLFLAIGQQPGGKQPVMRSANAGIKQKKH